MSVRHAVRCSLWLAGVLCLLGGAAHRGHAAEEGAGLHVLLEQGAAPRSFPGDQGEPRGMAADFWQLWSSRQQTELRLMLAPVRRGIQQVQQGDADAFLEYAHLGQAPKGMLLGAAYAHSLMYLFFSSALEGISDVQDLGGLRLGVVDGSALSKAVASAVPFGTVLVPYATFEDVLTGASLGEVQAFIAPRTVAAHYLVGRDGMGEFLMVPDPVYSMQVSVLVRQGDEAVLARLQQGLTVSLLREREQIERAWGGAPLQQQWPWRAGVALLLALIILTCIILLWNRQLRHRVASATAELVALNETLEAEVQTRRQAEDELAQLNRVLESRIVERTKALGEKASQLQRANDQLQRMDEAKTAFLAAVSHELRTPLTSLRGFSKLIRRDFDRTILPRITGDAQATKRANRIQDNLGIMEFEGERLSRLINDYLDLARIESGRMMWRDQEVDPSTCVQHAVQAVAGRFAEKSRLDLQVQTPPDLPRILIDPDRLEQVLINLLSNAIKFTQTGEVQLQAAAHGEMVRFTITDTGPGIPDVDQGRIFDKFEQLMHYSDTLANTDAVGTGLGLSICKQIVEHYRGRIWVDSEVGKGSAFTFEVPSNATSRSTEPQRREA